MDEVSSGTGIPVDLLGKFEGGLVSPTGDQLLILADYFKCDYAELISREQETPLERTDTLFRRFGTAFSKPDRWSVREFLFLCESEDFLEAQLHQKKVNSFNFTKSGNYFKGHSEAAAIALRSHLEYAEHAAPRDIYSDLRRIGIHVFRRRLENSNISGDRKSVV